MKTSLTAIALGALLSCNYAAAQVAINQQGTGNAAYTEQQGTVGPDATPVATTIQIGNNNHAGDPTTGTPGILQREPFPIANARIYQEGDANTANIVQDGVVRPVNAIIEQRGNGNTAGISQFIQTWSDGSLYQNGNNNQATLDQRFVTDTGFSAVQNGSDNRLSALQIGTVYAPPTVSQTGIGNAVTLDLERLLGASTHIDQVGNMNTVDSIVRDGEGIVNSIQQNGNGNTASTYQIGGLPFGAGFVVDSSVITQAGDNNFASLLQEGANDARIKQCGNDNFAALMQTYVGPGDPNIGFIKQVGNGFTASLGQNGAGNNAGIYQH